MKDSKNISIKLSVNRLGEFTCRKATKGAQCGFTGARNYRYEVSIYGVDKHLTKEGFIIDNLEIEKYFKRKYHGKTMKAQSCELMAAGTVKYFRSYIQKNTPQVKCLGVRVRIWGSDKSFIEANWNVNDSD